MKAQSLATVGCLFVLAIFMGSTARADLSAGLVAYYPFGGNANDASGNGHNGTVHGAAPSYDRFGTPDSAYSFDGVNDYISAPYTSAFQFSTFTLAAWVQPTVDLSSRAGLLSIVGRGEDVTTDRGTYLMTVVGSGSSWGTGLAEHFEDAADTDYVYCSGYYPPAGAWTHVAVSRSGSGDVSIYAGGLLLNEWHSTPIPATTCFQELTMGARWCSPSITGPYDLIEFFPGSIDEVRLYNRPLTADEIRELSVVPVPGAALLGTIGLLYSGWRLRHRTD